MVRNQKWLWLILCIALLVLVGALGTSWNLVIVNHYEKMLALARSRFGQSVPEEWRQYPWWSILLGSLGFASILVLSIVVTWKLLVEMRANQAQSEFLAMISHELKSPLATLELSSNLLESDAPRKETTDKLWRSHKSELQRLKVEIERLLTASRWEHLRDRPKLQAIELVAWIRAREDRWTAILGENSSLQLSLPSEPFWILADPNFLDLITNNLVDNARKFALPEGAQLEVRLESSDKKQNTHWKLSFTDHGIGFDPRLRRKIFKRFYRAPFPQSRKSAGSGLGLYLGYRAARSLGLRLKSHSEGKGRGSRFDLSGVLRS
jgi:signal transduction histidine kinase